VVRGGSRPNTVGAVPWCHIFKRSSLTSLQLCSPQSERRSHVLAYAEWQAKDEDSADKQLWEDEWDDDDISDDFSKQLRAELERAATTPK
jgi:hypothetical protein